MSLSSTLPRALPQPLAERRVRPWYSFNMWMLLGTLAAVAVVYRISGSQSPWPNYSLAAIMVLAVWGFFRTVEAIIVLWRWPVLNRKGRIAKSLALAGSVALAVALLTFLLGPAGLLLSYWPRYAVARQFPGLEVHSNNRYSAPQSMKERTHRFVNDFYRRDVIGDRAYVTGPIDDATLDAIARNFPETIELRLANSDITDAGLKNLHRLWQLQLLDLSHTKITDKSLRDIGSLNLRRLNLSHTNITGEGFGSLAGIGTVIEIHLDHTQLTDNGLACVATAPWLNYLDIGQTAVTDQGIATLANCKSLRTLVAYRTQVTGAGFQNFKAPLNTPHLADTPLSADGWRNIGGISTLSTLSLDGVLCDRSDVDIVAQLTRLTSLTSLELDQLTYAQYQKLPRSLSGLIDSPTPPIPSP